MTSGDPRAVALSALGRAIGAVTDPGALHGAIAEATVVTLQARLARVWLDDPQARVLRAAGSFGIEPAVESALLDAVVLPSGAGVPGRIFASRTPEFTRDAPAAIAVRIAQFLARETAGQHAVARRLARMGVAVDQMTDVVRWMGRITRLEMLQHTAQDLPLTLDLKKSSRAAKPRGTSARLLCRTAGATRSPSRGRGRPSSPGT